MATSSKSSGFGAAGSGNIALARQLTAEHDPSTIHQVGEVSSRKNAASFAQTWKPSPSGGRRWAATFRNAHSCKFSEKVSSRSQRISPVRVEGCDNRASIIDSPGTPVRWLKKLECRG